MRGFASSLGARLKYGAKQALKKLLVSWGFPVALGEKRYPFFN